MTARDLSALRFLSADDVMAALPPLADRLALAERTMVALVADAELPPKIGVHPAPAASFAHAMPARLRGADPEGSLDLLGLKWIAGFPANASRGLATIHGLVVLNDPISGVPTAILDAGPITAARTAAISGLAVARFAPRVSGRPIRVAILGAGVQGEAHVAIVGHVLAGLDLLLFDRHPERAQALAARAVETEGIGSAGVARTAREATEVADVVITAASFGPAAGRQSLTPAWLGKDALVVAVDYATYVAAAVAREAALFIVDQREQFLANRDAGQFDGYPDPGATLGEAILAGTERPGRGRVLVTHLGVGLADLVFADAIVRRASTLQLGTALARPTTPR